MPITQLPAETAELTDQETWLTFWLHQQTFAVPIDAVVQVIAMPTITPVPRMNRTVEGLINLRGEAVPVINLHRHLGLPEPRFQLHTPIMIVRARGQTIGLIADEVQEVIQFPAQAIVQPQDVLPEGLRDVPSLRGMTYMQSRLILLLEVDQLFGNATAGQLVQAASVVSAAVSAPTLETEAIVGLAPEGEGLPC